MLIANGNDDADDRHYLNCVMCLLVGPKGVKP
jgi:hypothetical protein